MKRPRRYILTYLWTMPFDLLMWIFVLFVRGICGTKLHWQEGLWCELRKGSFLAKKWAIDWAGVTLGHGGIYAPGYSGGPGIDTVCERHEHIHVEQYEAAMLAAFVFSITAVAAGADWRVCLMAWLLGGAIIYMASLIQAWLRGEKPYEGSHLEEAAYSQDGHKKG